MASTSTAFWTAFDNAFKYAPSSEVRSLFLALFSAPGSPFDFNRLLALWRRHRSAGTYPDGFISDIVPLKRSCMRLAELQVALLDAHFGGDGASEQSSFELFGQGVLYDDSRPVGDKVHMMDTGGVQNPPIGYHRWHVFACSCILLDIGDGRWLNIGRHIGLAWAIQSDLKPLPDSRENPVMAPGRLASLRGVWMSMRPENLDDAFDAFPYPQVAIDQSDVERVKAILESLVGGQQIAAHGNYWRGFATGNDFVQYRVFDDPQLPLLIRGDANNSNLIKALEGRPPFDGTVYPRMPVVGMARRYATAAEVQFIRTWIDAGCN